MVELSIVIPSRDREAVLRETLERVLGQAAEMPVEVIVVYDGPSEQSREAWRLAGTGAAPVRVAEQEARGPGAARNRGIALARGPSCLFMGDDVWAEPGLLERHLEFHRHHPQEGAALLGLVAPAPPLDASAFIRWLHSEGVQFGYGPLGAGEAPPTCFWTANVSAKTSLLRAVGGFDESFTDAACEDTELGLRLARAGLRLHYDPTARALHHHPTNLAGTLERMRRVGRASRVLAGRAPELETPRRPGARHRAKAAVLMVLAAAGPRISPIRESAWHFLCDEARRESFWSVEPAAGRRLRIGDGLARLMIAAEAKQRAGRSAGRPVPARDRAAG